jgi:hypothetical protein
MKWWHIVLLIVIAWVGWRVYTKQPILPTSMTTSASE